MTNVGSLRTVIVSMAVGAVLAVLALAVGSSFVGGMKPASVDQPVIVYGER